MHNNINNSSLALSLTHARTHAHTHTHTHTHTQAQNQWLRQNVIDAHGNLLFCRECLVSCLGIHTTRLTRQRIIKQKQKDQPIVELTKREVVEQKLQDYVLHDDDDDDILTYGAWWKLVDDDEIVEVQFPHERHGLAGKESNHAKKQAMADFLDFVDINSQPNGRQAGSYSAQFFLLPKFTRIAAPREGEKKYEEKLQSSVVSQFNKAQREKGRQTCHNSAAANWLQKYRPKVALHPSMTDYCDTCKHLKEQLSRNQAVLNRLQQSGSASEGIHQTGAGEGIGRSQNSCNTIQRVL